MNNLKKQVENKTKCIEELKEEVCRDFTSHKYITTWYFGMTFQLFLSAVIYLDTPM